MTKSKRDVVVSVEWDDEIHDCPMSLRTWKQILAGKPVRRVEPYWYEGERFTGEWTFNATEPGSLQVGYDDGGEAFDGSLADAHIVVEGVPFAWQSAG